MHLIYACQIWGQKESLVRKLFKVQIKAMRIIYFKTNDRPADKLYHCNKTIKITDYIKLLNCMFVKNVLARNILINFQVTFRLANNMHQYHNRHAAKIYVILKKSQTQIYGIRSIEYQGVSFWNTL